MIERAANGHEHNYALAMAMQERLQELANELRSVPRNEEKIAFLENIIAVDPSFSLVYALMTQKPFPKGEEAMATNGWTAASYASSILKRRFPLGENAIIESKKSKGLDGKAYKKYINMLNERDPIFALAEDSRLEAFPMPAIRRKRKI